MKEIHCECEFNIQLSFRLGGKLYTAYIFLYKYLSGPFILIHFRDVLRLL